MSDDSSNATRGAHVTDRSPTSEVRALAGPEQLIDRLRHENRQLRLTNARLSAERRTLMWDTLTGLPSREYFDHRASQELSRSHRFDQPLGLVVIEIGNLRQLEALGPQVVEGALRWFARRLGASCREFDVPCRIGDGELGVLLPCTERCGSRAVAQRLASELGEVRRECPALGELALQLDFGVACAPWDAETAMELVIAAESDLYHGRRRRHAAAQRGGRSSGERRVA